MRDATIGHQICGGKQVIVGVEVYRVSANGI